jgi:hypothetical protein
MESFIPGGGKSSPSTAVHYVVSLQIGRTQGAAARIAPYRVVSGSLRDAPGGWKMRTAPSSLRDRAKE